MFKKALPFFIICETPLHAGSGDDLGTVDLPIQREKHTDFPKIEGSSLKGSIREAFEEKYEGNLSKKIDIHIAFGYDDDMKEDKVNNDVKKYFSEENKDFSGALGFTDARILLFPVKSVKGVFAWITCPKVLERFKKDLLFCFKDDKTIKDLQIPNLSKKESCLVCKENQVTIENKYLLLEEYAFEVKNDIDISPLLDKLPGIKDIENIKEKFVILSNDDFKDFVNLSTEVITRTKIDNDTGTVKAGALFTEEYLPTDTVMYSLALATPIFSKDKDKKGSFGLTKDEEGKTSEEEKVINFFKEIPSVIQIGGNATIGKGIVSIKILQKEGKKNV